MKDMDVGSSSKKWVEDFREIVIKSQGHQRDQAPTRQRDGKQTVVFGFHMDSNSEDNGKKNDRLSTRV